MDTHHANAQGYYWLIHAKIQCLWLGKDRKAVVSVKMCFGSLITHFWVSLVHCKKGNTKGPFEDLAQTHAQVSSKNPSVSPPWSELLTTSLTESA